MELFSHARPRHYLTRTACIVTSTINPLALGLSDSLSAYVSMSSSFQSGILTPFLTVPHSEHFAQIRKAAGVVALIGTPEVFDRDQSWRTNSSIPFELTPPFLPPFRIRSVHFGSSRIGAASARPRPAMKNRQHVSVRSILTSAACAGRPLTFFPSCPSPVIILIQNSTGLV